MSFDWVTHFDQIVTQGAANLGWPTEAFFRLVLAAVMGGLVGMERELRGRQAGFRTNLLVCLGSALVMIVSVSFAVHRWQAQSLNQGININLDPARIAYGVMTGVGFLGAGTIVQHRGSIRGLTTAAGLWCMAAVGLAVGFGLYVIAAFATGLILLALWILDYMEDLLPKLRYRNVVIRVQWTPQCIAQTVAQFKDHGLDVVDASFQRSEDLQCADITLRVAFTKKEQYFELERKLEGGGTYTLLATHEL
jgi:putative Mg2+ transporter-C (MgtC) family protein